VDLEDKNAIDRALSLLAVTLEANNAAPLELVVIGGAALNVLGMCARPTRDVDVLAIADGRLGAGTTLVKCEELPPPLASAVATVADILGLEPGWLNAGPTKLLDWGLPTGFEARLSEHQYGPRLTLLLPAREDLIRFKVYAAADLGPGRHTEDLRALKPTPDELIAGVRWARSQDPSEGFASMLAALLKYFGCEIKEGDLTLEP
jgi:hypothetical protein